jgi:hypothetical protein
VLVVFLLGVRLGHREQAERSTNQTDECDTARASHRESTDQRIEPFTFHA